MQDRLEYELGVISNMGFSDYFLVVWDLIQHARTEGIRVGPGRGSAAGCCVAYCLRIVDLDPIRYDLLFERFLNPGRQQMPDIDMDFDERYRGEMIRYATERYGWDHVAQIVTFSTIKARAAVRDAARVLGLPYSVGDRIAKAMPPLVMGRDTPLSACLEVVPGHEDGYHAAIELRDMYSLDPDAKKVIDVARGLEGLRRQDGIHAAAVVISADPLTEYLPIQRKPEPGGPADAAPIVTQYEMHGVEELGLLKMDFLGLRNLSVIERALDLIEANTGTRPDIDAVALDDPAVFEMLRRADSIGVFQLEGSPMRALTRALAPTSFDDICALIALYRPGPDGGQHALRLRRPQERPQAHHLPASRHGRGPGRDPGPDDLPGVDDAGGPALRRATPSRKPTTCARRRARRTGSSWPWSGRSSWPGAWPRATGRELGSALFDIIEPFADYAFNKSHSYGYGLVSYQTAWLKANYPVEYLAALLTSVKDDKDKTAVYLAECRARGIEVLVPDVNLSVAEFTAVRGGGAGKVGAIPFGLAAVRNVGEGLVERIVAARVEGGPFRDFYDFCERVDPVVLNKRTIESLIKAGAFDSLGHPRQGLCLVAEQIVDRTLARRREREQGVMSLFGDFFSDGHGGGSPLYDDTRVPVPAREFDKRQRLVFEKEMLGLYVSDHPLIGVESALRRHVDVTVRELRELPEGELRTVGGVITGLTRKYTKRGELMATFTLEDLESTVDVWVFPRTMSEVGHLLATTPWCASEGGWTCGRTIPS